MRVAFVCVYIKEESFGVSEKEPPWKPTKLLGSGLDEGSFVFVLVSSGKIT